MSAYDPQPGEAAGILPKLTLAQSRAVTRGTVGQAQFDRGPGYWPLRNALYRMGLFCSADRKDVLTPLGREVQDLIRRDG